MRARAVHIAREHRRYLAEFGRLPSCPLDQLEWSPLESYLRATEAHLDPGHVNAGEDVRYLSTPYIANRLGCIRGTVSRLRTVGYLSRPTAEQFAHALDVHPAEIWSDYWFDLGPLNDGSVSAA
ncbi:MAG: hypothetical protein KDB37_12840 [Ilumatobacter sp.]|nr:hypothetical protein [Ilumatobacter sp.]